jgi:hypothetical protein
MKNKTLAVWITFLVGPLGLGRLYLKGKFDATAWMLILPTLIGLYGIQRARSIGLDDQLSWLLIPLLGLSFSVTSITAIVYALTDIHQWNRKFNAGAAKDCPAGQTGWMTIIGAATALFIGATVLIATIAYSFEHFFDYQYDKPVAQLLVQRTDS